MTFYNHHTKLILSKPKHFIVYLNSKMLPTFIQLMLHLDKYLLLRHCWSEIRHSLVEFTYVRETKMPIDYRVSIVMSSECLSKRSAGNVVVERT